MKQMNLSIWQAHKDKHVKLNYSLCNVGMDSGMEIECRWNIVIISNSDKFAGYLSFVNRAGARDPFWKNEIEFVFSWELWKLHPRLAFIGHPQSPQESVDNFAPELLQSVHWLFQLHHVCFPSWQHHQEHSRQCRKRADKMRVGLNDCNNKERPKMLELSSLGKWKLRDGLQ